ncbi:hypothetical protein A3I99_01495 [Candidatus Kaiserbacteria bacterium RIFCSPLOWO2_02_FULL_45_11b]|nr:MAG: hypothetical protein A3I99_01495 [Candidatus Kaiserbacteria bacterium RIFCSPLOWO2_02_FULL_45_11b]
MSSNRLDSVNTFDQFGHDHWKALGTKLGGVEVVKAILRETTVVTVEPVRRPTALTPAAIEPVTSYLTHLASVTLAPTKGSVTIAYAADVFVGYLDPDFKNWGTDVGDKDTAAQTVSVHEMNRDGTFAQIFGSLGDPQSLCLTQGQIVEFCRSNRDQLRQGGYATFFLFVAKGELSVARVHVFDDQLKVYVRLFGDGHVWGAVCRRRVVVLQQ